MIYGQKLQNCPTASVFVLAAPDGAFIEAYIHIHKPSLQLH